MILRQQYPICPIRCGAAYVLVAASVTQASTAEIDSTSTSRLKSTADQEHTPSFSQHQHPTAPADNVLLLLAFPAEPSPTIASPTDPGEEAEEVETMGVIRKKTATRGGEGGVKYVCDVCSADITSTVGAPLLRPFARLGATKRSCITVGTHPMRQSALQRIRPVCSVLRGWSILT